MYKNKTPRLGIPYVGYGDRILPNVEEQKCKILENQLLAARHGLKCCVFEEGIYKLRNKTELLSYVTLTANGQRQSALGVIGGLYFEAKPNLIWDDLKNGFIYYLYLRKTAKLRVNNHEILLISSQIEKDLREDNLILMAVVDLRKDKFRLDTKPPKKINAKDLYSHVGENNNPHGSFLIQDNLEITRKLSFNAKNEDSIIDIYDERETKKPLIKTTGEIILQDKRSIIQLSDENNDELVSGDSVIGAINECLSQKRIFLDFEGDGNDILTIPKIKKILAVTISYKFNPNYDSTDISTGYHEDGFVEGPNEFAIFSKGRFSARFIIDCEV